MEEFDSLRLTEIPIENIKVIPSDIEIPVYNNPIQTRRSLCSNFPTNRNIIRRIEHDINTSDETCINNIPQYIKELQAVFNTSDPEECGSNLFNDKEYQVIDNLKELQKLLSELIIRFDTDPKFYTREDYSFLMAVLYKSLLFIYKKEIKEITLGDNLSQIASAEDHLIDLKYPVAIDPSDTIINEEQTLPSIAYLDKFVLRWEEF